MKEYTVKDRAVTYSDGTTLTYDGLIEKLEKRKRENPERYFAWIKASGKTEEEHKTYLRECFDVLESEQEEK